MTKTEEISLIAQTSAALLVGATREEIADALEKFSRKCFEAGIAEGQAHKEAPASKDGWAKLEAKDLLDSVGHHDEFCARSCNCVTHIEAALLEAEERGRHDGYHVGFNEGTLHCGDEALLRECLYSMDGWANSNASPDLIEKLRARLTPKGTGEKEKK